MDVHDVGFGIVVQQNAGLSGGDQLEGSRALGAQPRSLPSANQFHRRPERPNRSPVISKMHIFGSSIAICKDFVFRFFFALTGEPTLNGRFQHLCVDLRSLARARTTFEELWPQHFLSGTSPCRLCIHSRPAGKSCCPTPGISTGNTERQKQASRARSYGNRCRARSEYRRDGGAFSDLNSRPLAQTDIGPTWIYADRVGAHDRVYLTGFRSQDRHLSGFCLSSSFQFFNFRPFLMLQHWEVPFLCALAAAMTVN